MRLRHRGGRLCRVLAPAHGTARKDVDRRREVGRGQLLLLGNGLREVRREGFTNAGLGQRSEQVLRADELVRLGDEFGVNRFLGFLGRRLGWLIDNGRAC